MQLCQTQRTGHALMCIKQVPSLAASDECSDTLRGQLDANRSLGDRSLGDSLYSNNTPLGNRSLDDSLSSNAVRPVQPCSATQIAPRQVPTLARCPAKGQEESNQRWPSMVTHAQRCMTQQMYRPLGARPTAPALRQTTSALLSGSPGKGGLRGPLPAVPVGQLLDDHNYRWRTCVALSVACPRGCFIGRQADGTCTRASHIEGPCNLHCKDTDTIPLLTKKLTEKTRQERDKNARWHTCIVLRVACPRGCFTTPRAILLSSVSSSMRFSCASARERAQSNALPEDMGSGRSASESARSSSSMDENVWALLCSR